MQLDVKGNLRMAMGTLRENKLRSFLTVLGVVIGVTALISVASIMVGLDRDIRGFLNDYGTDLAIGLILGIGLIVVLVILVAVGDRKPPDRKDK